MKITAVTRLKHGMLYQALRRLQMTQTELAKECKCDQTTICSIVCLKSAPKPKLAMAIQKALGKRGEYLDLEEAWPEQFKGLPKTTFEATAEVPLDRLLSAVQPSPVGLIEQHETEAVVAGLLATLTPDEKEVMERHYFDGEPLTGISSSKRWHPSHAGEVLKVAMRKVRRRAPLQTLGECVGKSATPILALRAQVRKCLHELAQRDGVDAGSCVTVASARASCPADVHFMSPEQCEKFMRFAREEADRQEELHRERRVGRVW